jgi:hypothetical protein
VVLIDASDITVGRVDGAEFPDLEDRIVTTVNHPEIEVVVALFPEDFMSFLIAGLNGLGFPQADLEYLAERFQKEFK